MGVTVSVERNRIAAGTTQDVDDFRVFLHLYQRGESMPQWTKRFAKLGWIVAGDDGATTVTPKGQRALSL